MAPTALATATLTGCFAPGGDEERKPGPAASQVTVVRGDVTYPLTAKITNWEVGPHPQVPDRGDAVHFTYRTTKTAQYLPEPRVALAVCALDSADAVLLCDTIDVYDGVGVPRAEDGDTWLGPDSDPDRLSHTARVVLLPDQLLGDGRAHDPKDHDGYDPPDLPSPGDRLRTDRPRTG
ncbi:hypothetical protein ABZ840_07155 [Streptomyces sp. NPDC047117]|uniref:hypothetical protein n=1 Tax=unclassified Streptomyces TaxID=2593676 RepID=UPI00340CD5A9